MASDELQIFEKKKLSKHETKINIFHANAAAV